jgi:hypothetical protein
MSDRTVLTVLVAFGLGVSFLSPIRIAKSSVVAKEREQTMSRLENYDKSKFVRHLPDDFEFPADEAGELLLKEYGAVFVARNGVVPPKKVFFRDEADVQGFQSSVKSEGEDFGGIHIELQKAALRALEKAVKDAKKLGISITPRGGVSGRRGYNQTIELWKSRVEPGLSYWVGKRRIKASKAAEIRRLPIRQQITEILRLEQSEIYFAKSLDKSIIYSVAPPGSSQHLAMLALDVKEFDDPTVRSILAERGWFQTVISDLPHFTYLGVSESKLSGLGLKKVQSGNRSFWVPDLSFDMLKTPGSGK